LLLNAVYWGPAFGHFLSYGGLFPYRHNLLSPWGAFSGTLERPLMPGLRPLILDFDARLILSLLGCLAGAALLMKGLGWACSAGPAGAILLFTAWQVPFMLIAPEIHDRYILMLLPGALALAAWEAPQTRWTWIPAVLCVLLIGACSVCLMHDWLAWNRARWDLGNRALSRRIQPQDIEGGFEWDGWHGNVTRDKNPGERQGLALEFLHSWFPHITGRYALSFSELPDSVTVDSEPYTLWLKPGVHRLFLLEYRPEPYTKPASTRGGH
jgi:hypothetical protein